MGRTFNFLRQGRENRQFDNPLIFSGLGLGRNNKFTSKKEDRRAQRRAKQKRQELALDW